MGIARLRELTGESESTFGVENGAHSFADVRAFDVSLTNDQTMHDEMVNRARVTTVLEQVLGRKSANSRLGFSCYLRGDGVALASGATATDDTLQDLLTLAMGGTTSDEGGTVSGATSTTIAIDVQAGEGSRFGSGRAIMVEGTGPNGENEISIVESVTSDTLNLKIALTNAPTDGDNVWNSYTSYIDPSSTTSWQFQALGDDAADIWLALGCVGGFTLGNLLSIQDLPRIAFDLFVASWEKDSGTMAAGSYDGGDLLGTTEGMEIHYQTHANTTRNLISCSALDIVPNITWTPLNARGNADVQHVDRVRMTSVEPTASFTADPSSAFWTTHTAQTDKLLAVMFGRTPGQSWCIELPKIRISAAPQRAEHGEQVATTCNFRAYEDDAGGLSTALALSPFRLHRL
jgi:hypothetical protein